MTGLCDCNTFFASCERLFRPDLRNKPLVVLSNNDGCIVALTREAKALGIRRGEPYFKVRDAIMANGVSVFSSNYPLYQDISDRVMDILASMVPSVEAYSIDEAFFDAGGEPKDDEGWQQLERRMRRTAKGVSRFSGVPVSVGVARNRTLAKLANHEAKELRTGYHVLRPEMEEELLRRTPLGDVWGIGWRRCAQLQRLGLRTAYDLTLRDDRWIERHCTVTGLQTAWELQGKCIIGPENLRLRTLCSGISFSEPKTEFDDVFQTLCCHCTTLASKMWARKILATELAIHVSTSRFGSDPYSIYVQVRPGSPTAYPPYLCECVSSALRSAWSPGRKFNGSRVWVTDYIPCGNRQYRLFDSPSEMERDLKEDALNQAVCEISTAYGRDSLLCASTGNKMKIDLCTQAHLSPRYTTRWGALPVAT